VGSYSILGNNKVLEPETSSAFDVLTRQNGVSVFDPEKTSAHLMPSISNLTSPISSSVFAETWSDLWSTALSRTSYLKSALDVTELETSSGLSSNGDVIESQFFQVGFVSFCFHFRHFYILSSSPSSSVSPPTPTHTTTIITLCIFITTPATIKITTTHQCRLLFVVCPPHTHTHVYTHKT
jgi:hypothetical protein